MDTESIIFLKEQNVFKCMQQKVIECSFLIEFPSFHISKEIKDNAYMPHDTGEIFSCVSYGVEEQIQFIFTIN